jgi:hypothetical protein
MIAYDCHTDRRQAGCPDLSGSDLRATDVKLRCGHETTSMQDRRSFHSTIEARILSKPSTADGSFNSIPREVGVGKSDES